MVSISGKKRRLGNKSSLESHAPSEQMFFCIKLHCDFFLCEQKMWNIVAENKFSEIFTSSTYELCLD